MSAPASSTPDAVFIYVTAANGEEAHSIAKALVGERLIACANVLPAVQSVYWWDGAVQTDTEVVLIMKSQAGLVDRITNRVKDLHSYDCPCVVALPIEGGNSDYLEWIAAETAGA